MEIDFNQKYQIENDIKTIEHLLSLNPFFTITDIEVQKAIFTEIMICLRDLVAKSANILQKTIDFDDDVIKISKPQKVSNVADLIAFVRNALCHQDSENHKFDTNTLSYCISFGNEPNGFVINGQPMGSNYGDDFCIIFGVQKIYYKRHIIRAFEECKQNFKELLRGE